METLAELLIEKGFQYVFIDCPAGIDIGFLNAIAPAKEAVIVTTPEITSIRDADRVVRRHAAKPRDRKETLLSSAR